VVVFTLAMVSFECGCSGRFCGCDGFHGLQFCAVNAFPAAQVFLFFPRNTCDVLNSQSELMSFSANYAIKLIRFVIPEKNSA
jgi:hypothetical protein